VVWLGAAWGATRGRVMVMDVDVIVVTVVDVDVVMGVVVVSSYKKIRHY
jgi:hypothetical protein